MLRETRTKEQHTNKTAANTITQNVLSMHIRQSRTRREARGMEEYTFKRLL